LSCTCLETVSSEEREGKVYSDQMISSLGHFFTKLSSHLAAMGPQAKAL
jgi:hypothetical protein